MVAVFESLRGHRSSKTLTLSVSPSRAEPALAPPSLERGQALSVAMLNACIAALVCRAPIREDTMSDFLPGERHGEILATLQRLATDRKAEEPRVVIIEGPSGVGKTRIVQELYRSLREREADIVAEQGAESKKGRLAAFWPPLEADAELESVDATMLDRKVIGPDLESFMWPQYSLPTFAWWPINCDRSSDGRPIDVISVLQPAFAEFHLPLKLAQLQKDAGGRLGLWAGDVAEILKDQAISWVKDEAVNGLAGLLPVPGLITALSLAKDLATTVRRRQKEHSDYASDRDLGIGEKRKDAAEKMADDLKELARDGLPAVVVVEDIHMMSSSVARLLTELLTADTQRPVLIVGTAWASYEKNPVYTEWRAQVIDTELQVETLEGMPADDLARLLRNEAPATSEKVVDAVVERYSNPLALKIFLTLPRFRRKLHEHPGEGLALELGDGDLEALPWTMQELQREQWDALPEHVQQALIVAAASLGGPEAGLDDFDRDVVSRAAARLDQYQESLVREGLAEARTKAGWAAASLSALANWDRFREPAYAAIADERFDDWLDPSDRTGIVAAVVGELRARIAEQTADGSPLDPFSAEARRVARWLIALLPEAETREDTLAQVVEVFSDFWYADVNEADSLAAMPEKWLELVDPGNVLTMTVRRELGHWRGATDGWEAAHAEFMAIADEAAARAREATGPEASHAYRAEWLEDLHMAGYALGQIGDWAAAARLFDQIVAEKEIELGASHERTLAARRNNAYAYGMAGDRGTAIERYRALVSDAETFVGPLGGATLEARSELLGELRDGALHATSRTERIQYEEEMLSLLQRTRELIHPDDMEYRAWLADAMLTLGSVHVRHPFPPEETMEARNMLKDALAIYERVNSQEDPADVLLNTGHDEWVAYTFLTIAEAALEKGGRLSAGTTLAALDRMEALALPLDEGDGDSRLARSIVRRARYYEYVGDPANALRVWRAALRASREQHNETSEQQALERIAVLAAELGFDDEG